MWLKGEAALAIGLAAVAMRISPARWERTLKVIPRCASARSAARDPVVLAGAVDAVIVWCPTSVFCLQRAWAIALLCRRRGIEAQVVLGTRARPFRAHAWVEIQAIVLGDDGDQIRRWYSVVQRFG